ncbi:MAG TPA: HAMP domain-containing sensor histidine kinase [Polyangia bacterium]|nr:HAMP domain-containing sensor histidine kinase [Polyangia bacterium]
MADDGAPPKPSDRVDFVTANLTAMAATLPSLMERLRALAAAEGRADVIAPLLPSDAERIAGFARYLELFGRQDARPPEPLDVAAVAERVLDVTRAEVARYAQLVRAFSPAPLVRATERQLGQLLVSLVLNGAQSIPEGDRDHQRVTVRIGYGDDGWARIDIEDTGSGIAADHVQRIFEPLYSTKRGAGAGVGLAIVRDTVAALGGRLAVKSEVGRGSCFRVELPPA